MTDAVLFRDGRVFTGTRYAEALLVEDGRVVGVGSLDAVRALAPTGTEHRRLGGRLLLPGLVDAHLHLAEIARFRAGLDLSAAGSVDDLLARLRSWAAEHPTGPIVGRGWGAERWTDRRWPEAPAIDRAVGDRPVVLYHVSGHAAVANSVALAAAGLEGSEPRASDPTVGRFADGRPNGQLFESTLHRLSPLVDAASPVGPEALAATLADLAHLGLTAVGSMAASLEEVAALLALDAEGRVPIVVRAYLRLKDRSLLRRRETDRSGRFAVVGVKAFLDGAFGPRTAWLRAPYADGPGGEGVAVGEEAALREELAEAVELGLAPALHAIGDRALERALRLLAPFAGRTDAPGRIEHAGLTPPDLLPALDRGRPVLVVQPGFVWSDGWLGSRLGPERARWAYAFRSLRARGIPLAGSTDAPYDPVDPWRGIRAAVRRRAPDGRSANPESTEALPAEEAVGLFTANAARALGLGSRGVLEPGAAADLVVLSAPGLVEALAAPTPPVEETWVDGRPLPRAPGVGGP